MTEEIIVIKDLSYRYERSEEMALREINLRVKRGEFLAVMGPTGAGKTTLCLTLNGIVPHFYGGDFYGSVEVCGLDSVEHHTYELAQRVGMVFEDPETQLTAPTVANEVAFPLENVCVPAAEMHERVAHALETVRLAGLDEKHPHQLSGGQKQRLAIAAALALRPSVMVLDEPTSQLDPVGTDEVFSVVRDLNRELGMTIVLVSHASEEVAEYADRVILLSKGEIAEAQTPQRFFQGVELLTKHELRPPDVTSAFALLQPNGAGGITEYPVTLDDAVRCCRSLKPSLRYRDVAHQDGERKDGAKTVLQTRDLHYTYPDGTEALRGVTLDVGAGEYVAIVGQNGGGKSTLVKHFLHLLTATEGEVRVRGKNVNQYEVSDLAKHIGFISQNPDNQIFSDTVEKEVSFALKQLKYSKEEIEARVTDALRQMRLEWAIERHPLSLSKGDRSRIVVAAILAMKPEILIFDEPTTGQDYAGSRAILELTQELHEAGKTIIVITHHLYLLPGYAERLLVMGKGKLLLDTDLRSGFYATEKLNESFLTAPQIVQLAKMMQEEAPVRLRPLTAREFTDAVTIKQEALP